MSIKRRIGKIAGNEPACWAGFLASATLVVPTIWDVTNADMDKTPPVKTEQTENYKSRLAEIKTLKASYDTAVKEKSIYVEINGKDAAAALSLTGKVDAEKSVMQEAVDRFRADFTTDTSLNEMGYKQVRNVLGATGAFGKDTAISGTGANAFKECQVKYNNNIVADKYSISNDIQNCMHNRSKWGGLGGTVLSLLTLFGLYAGFATAHQSSTLKRWANEKPRPKN